MPWGMPGAVLTDMVRGKIPGEMQRSTTRESQSMEMAHLLTLRQRLLIGWFAFPG